MEQNQSFYVSLLENLILPAVKCWQYVCKLYNFWKDNKIFAFQSFDFD